uniref:Uncharacterized protein n=1 Tax=Nelumbo nucifera TaxID=4432 RepID=A0A822XK73_NELNU|nr:TPA_asm: hypothetical protein HUJ06_021576 [Nelumbo nucifera]
MLHYLILGVFFGSTCEKIGFKSFYNAEVLFSDFGISFGP